MKQRETLLNTVVNKSENQIMKKIFLVLLFVPLAAILFSSFTCSTPNTPDKKDLFVAFYNTENFFDTINEPNVQDEEFLPDAKAPWTSSRYETKVNHIAKVIADMNGGTGPDLIGLSEIENDIPLKDLITDPQLVQKNYAIVHYESPDVRGIDVALLYKQDVVKVLSSETLPVKIDSIPDFKTRDILMVKMQQGSKVFYVFVNHWPSRRGGTEVSEAKRCAAAQVLKNKVDEIWKQDSKARIIIMGDLNDDPINKSVNTVLDAHDNLDDSPPFLFNFGSTIKDSTGSIFYKGLWDLFDQIIVSNNFALSCSTCTQPCGFVVDTSSYLLQKNKYNEMEPFRTWAGTNYLGGYSDHLPVTCILHWK